LYFTLVHLVYKSQLIIKNDIEHSILDMGNSVTYSNNDGSGTRVQV